MLVKPVLRVLRGAASVLAPWIGAGLIRSLAATVHVRIEGLDYYRTGRSIPEPTLFVFWHDQLLAMIVSLIGRGRPYGVLISRHPDAEPIARAVSRLGLDVVRGSSSRGGGTALGELVRYLRGGGSVVFTPDGPRGPRHRAGDGALIIAQRARVRIVPVGCAVRPRFGVASWDRLQIPLPFARGAIVEGEALAVPAHAGTGQREKLRRQLQRDLEALTARAEAMVGRK